MQEPPGGTVTFLFTDIENSTRLWDRFPLPMRELVARHDSLLRQQIEQYGGYYFKNRGDGCCAAFGQAAPAIQAAVGIQRSLLAQSWSPVETFRVRIALLTGEASARDGDYFGTALNRLSRLMDAGHGGQTLLSASTYSVVRDVLPPDVTLTLLGSHSLKDLQHPEQIYQLEHPALPSDFPPLRSLEAFAHNLPLQLTTFVGRDAEMVSVREMLAKTRLLTLTGSGGCGKTRLAFQVAADLVDTYDGVYLVELAGLEDERAIPQALATVLGVGEEATRPLEQTLIEYLRARRPLLILDNCEHIIETCAHLAETLLKACPHLTILATSREVLGIAGETSHRVPSLSAPEGNLHSLDTLAQYEAVQLFVERAQAALPTFALTEASAAAVVEICQRLDGIPLALELAARRVKNMSVERIAGQLDYCFAILTGGSRTAMERQQTLRATIEWSYRLLTPEEQTALYRLAVFVNGFSLEAAEAICATPEGMEAPLPLPETTPVIYPSDVLDLLMRLVDKSLVQFEAQENGDGRYRLLETIRQYGWDKLMEAGEDEATRDRHRNWYIGYAEQTEPKLRGSEQALWIRRTEQEHDNLRAALKWALDPETRLRLAGALYGFWQVRGYLHEGRGWLEGGLARGGKASGPVYAKALNAAGVLAWMQNDIAAAQGFYEQGLETYRTMNDRPGIAKMLNNLALIAHRQGDYATMRANLEQCQPIFHAQQDYNSEAVVLNNLGLAATEQEDYAAAQAYLEGALTLARDKDFRNGMILALHNLGEVAFRQGKDEAARVYYVDSLRHRVEGGDRRAVPFSLHSLGMLALRQEQYRRAGALLGAAEVARKSMDTPLRGGEQQQFEETIATWRQTQGESAFQRDWQRGAALTLEQAVVIALDSN